MGLASWKSKRWMQIVSLVLLMLLVLLLAVVYLDVQQQESLFFEDIVLETAIRELINKPSGAIYVDDLSSLKELSLRDNGITSLAGLEHVTGLVKLDLRGNQLQDIGVIGSLRLLRELDLRDNLIVDVTELQYLSNLRVLNLRNNLIEDITALGHLDNLRELNVRDNVIEDITVLSRLAHLMDLNLRDNQIKDVSALVELPFLRQRIYLEGNPIYDSTPLRDIVQDVSEVDFEIGVAAPFFSEQGGFYDEAFYLELSTPVQETEIYYTLDGSEPDPELNEARTFRYNGPIFIQDRSVEENRLSMIRTAYDSIYTYWKAPSSNQFKSTLVRSVLYKGDIRSKVSTQTFFVTEGVQQRYTLPVLSISANEENLFDSEIGIYVDGNWRHTGREWEREAYLEFYEPDGRLGFSQGIGLRIHGGWSREAPQKTLRLYARNEYGSNRIEYDIFELNEAQEVFYQRLLLRNSGNDFHKTLFRDGLMQQLVDGMHFDTQQFRPAILFINGEYWGIHNIRERYDSRYLANKYGLEREEVTILENEGELDDGSEDGLYHYEQMLQFVQNQDLSQDKNYDMLGRYMDIDSFIDYTVAQVYVANTDWPQNNVRLWRLNSGVVTPEAIYGHDGKWRWMLFDTDYGFGARPGLGYAGGSTVDTNMLQRLVGEEQGYQLIFTALLANDGFQEQFIARMLEMLDTSFEAERVLGEIEELYQIYSREIEEHISRWSIPESREVWEAEVQVLRQFARERPRYVREHLEQLFGRAAVEQAVGE